ncbi:sulfotransferase family 2 domain-containing protein [Pacificibacter marinus]|uniref:Sulfotransferase family protein n=1 Tax=Pacificibacter marinus TaxID=658057 RepID=A0A1Y5RFQ1_9RHOB|nr:sulfotransferase family 2 domain-containing protein [Pacificibacter marinus]SEK24507.1 Sulfotransferase family protein [Pacificibacter marinus]SLN13814.1 Sulfotransferase family protein [Pacificibacter marinus]
MIISHGRKYIFVHIPKTGGSALSLALETRAMADDILIGDTPKAVQRRARVKTLQSAGRLWKHARLADIEGVVARDAFEDFFIFTLVRNPWDRIVSYYHWLQLQNWDHSAVHLAKSKDFSNFLNTPETLRSLSVPSAFYMQDGAGRDRSTAYMRIETLEADLAPLWTHLGFNLGPIARVNTSKRARDFRGYYTDADQDTVAKLCATDIAQFGYDFTPSGLRETL